MNYVVFAVCVAICILVLYVIGLSDKRRYKKAFREKLESCYGKPSDKEYVEGRLAAISSYCEKTKQKADFYIDDITWNDLDMDRIYRSMDFTFSAAGEEVLYKILRCPVLDKKVLEDRDEKIEYFRTHKEERIKLQMLFATVGKTGKYSIVDYIDYLDDVEPEKLTKHIALLAGMALSLTGMLFYPWECLVVFFVLLAVNIWNYFPAKRKIEPYITTFAYLVRVIRSVDKLEWCRDTVFSKEVEELRMLRGKTMGFTKGAFFVFGDKALTSNPLDILMDYAKMCLHIDIFKFYRMLREAKEHKQDFLRIFEITGGMEAVLSILAYRESLEFYCKPEFTRKLQIGGKQVYHPLISNPVTNSFSEEKGMLLTGSNASGKSTFLKAVAINAILAQTIYTCMAKSFRLCSFRVYTSMALRDDLQKQESYFIVEIKALKRVLEEASKGATPVLCFVDEVLRGTNTVERIAASTEILKSLSGKKTLCFAATHDIELTWLLEDCYHNCHFEETILEKDIQFNYKLLEGRATTRNAIKLLGILSYEEEMINRAEQRAESFLKTGKWV